MFNLNTGGIVKYFNKVELLVSVLLILALFGCQSQYMTAGKVYYDQSPPNYDAAIEQFKLAIQAEPQNPETYLWLGKAYAGKKQYEEACKQTEKAISVEPNIIDKLKKDTQFNYWAIFYNGALKHMQKKEYELAAKTIKRSLDFENKNVQSLNLLAFCYEKLEKDDDAEKAYKKAVELVSDNMDAYINLSNFYTNRKKLGEAETILKKSLKVIGNPDWLKAENAELAKKRKEEAKKIYVDLGNILLRQDKAKESEAIFVKAIELNPDDRDVNFNYGLVLIKLDKFTDATRVFKKVVSLGEKDAEAEFYLGYTYLKSEKYTEAIAAFTKSIEADPDYCDSYINRAFAERELGNTSAAYNDAKLGIECQKKQEKK